MAEESPKPHEPSEANKPPKPESKIRIDADWKKQAQVEKERLARQVERKEPKAKPAEGAPRQQREARLPPADFSTLAQALATQAAVFLSDRRDPKTGESLQRLDLAKHHIDLLSVLEEKTKGNLTDGEKRLMDTLLYELRLAYVAAAS